ncbi:Lipase B [Paraphaeosphaeria sporulosa]
MSNIKGTDLSPPQTKHGASRLLAASFLVIGVHSVSTNSPKPESTIAIRAPVPEPQLLSSLVGGLVGTKGALTATLVQALNGTLTQLLHPMPTSSPKDTDDIFSYVQGRFRNRRNARYVQTSINYTLNGEGSQGINSFTNINSAPPRTIYPRAEQMDAKFSVSELALRSAIFIPSTFQAANAPSPVLLVPGTATMGGVNFDGNFAKILQADPSNGQPGNLDTQWALKYFPSTRVSVKQLISISPDFHGTILANLIDIPTDVGQSRCRRRYYNRSMTVATWRNFARTAETRPTSQLRPSTFFDNIVQPQQALEALRKARAVPASEIDFATVCQQAVYPWLELTDVLETEPLIPLAAINILEYVGAAKGSLEEPSLRSYAT